MNLILLWALVALIGRAHCKCSLAPIVDDERSIAYACIHSDLKDLDEISSEAEWIEFSVSRIENIPDNAFWRFRNLRRLSFYNSHIHVISPDAFHGLDHLDWLIFHGTRIHVAKAAWFRHLPNLRRLILDRCGLIHVEPEIFPMLQRLETLGLRDNDLSCLSVNELWYLNALKTIRIDGNPWLCDCREKMEKFFQSRSILQEEDVCLKGPGVYRNLQCMTQIDTPILPPSFTAQDLRIFEKEYTSIRGSEFQTSALTSLDRLPDKTSWIEITGLQIDRIPTYAFFRFGNTLRTLDLRDCYISTIEPDAFAGLHKLQRLSLTGNQFPAVGVNWFRNLVALQQLNLNGNGIEQVDREAFLDLRDNLRHLDIRNNRLRCLDIELLRELRKLERLDAVGNPWTCDCRRDLEKFLTVRNIGYEISAGRCYENENEIPELPDGWRQATPPPTVIGKVQYGTFEETISKINITIPRPIATPLPQPPPPVTHRPTTRPPRPPIHEGSCTPDRNDHSQQIYSCSGIVTISALKTIPHTVHSIRIILSNLPEIPPNTFARFDGYLRRLEFRDCGIERIHQRAFAGLYNLEYLSLHGNDLESVTPEYFEGLSNLRYLDLSRNHILRISNEVFDVLPYLTHVDISENSMNCIGVEYIAQRLQYLRDLKVHDNPWSCLCGTKLANFLDSRGIPYDRETLVDISEECYVTRLPSPVDTPATTIGSVTEPTQTVNVIVPITAVPTITIDVIEGSCASFEEETGLRYRCTGGNLLLLNSIPPNVAVIEFYEGSLPNIPAGTFSRFHNLRELDIRNSGIRGIESGAFEGLDKLETLAIQHNPLVTLGPSWFVLKGLNRLDLRGNSIKYIAPGAFRGLDQLEYLNLEGNDVKCIFTSDLNDMPNVHTIEFSANPLKWRCRVELEQFLESRKIKFVRVENSCEGKKLVMNLLLQNVTECEGVCSSGDKAASRFVTVVTLVWLNVMWFY